MKDNAFVGVILALIILGGSIFISFTQKKEIEEYNIILTINGTEYGGIIYSNNKVIVNYQSCLGTNCYIEQKKYQYSDEQMLEFRNLLNNYNFEKYESEKTYDSILYDVINDKAIYDIDYKLVNSLKKILLGNL